MLPISLLLVLASLSISGLAGAQEVSAFDAPPAPVMGLRAYDTPDDAGGSITLRWRLSSDDAAGAADVVEYRVMRGTSPGGPFELVKAVPKGSEGADDTKDVENGVKYFYVVVAADASNETRSEAIGPVESHIQALNLGRLNTLIATAIFISLLMYFILGAKKGKALFVRRIAGLDALDEAVGRATEMGRPILYVPGLTTLADVATIASINILSGVARKVAEYESRLIMPNFDPVVMTVSQEVVREAYLAAGKPDAYREQDVFYVTSEQFAYVAAVDGIMVRDRPATNLYMGMFFAESLILAETGAMTGAIQIAGTDAVAQLPFFIAACDYTLIGEELYAASAYLSRAPLLLGSLKGQDWMKIIATFCIIVGAIGVFLGFPFLRQIFDTPLGFFR